MGREKTAAATVTQNKVPESAQRAVASLGRKTTLFGEEKDCEKSLRSLKRLWERARERAREKVREREQRSRAVIECAASRATASKASHRLLRRIQARLLLSMQGLLWLPRTKRRVK